MQTRKKCVAMLLAGGQGSRLYSLTKKRAKPAVPFGGKYRIIDFPLSNCINSGIDTVGVLTQYEPLELNAYIGTGAPWDLDVMNGGAYILPPYVRGKKGEWYAGTANAVYQNLQFINRFNPEHILILSGDHIYKMDYEKMLHFHEKNQADATIAVIEVPMEEASRFGIMNTDEDNRITEFEEKPANPKSNKASMGIYIFKWNKIKQYLIEDEEDETSEKDFGKNIIPKMLKQGEKMYAYSFDGYWRDVGTIQSLWEANMELIDGDTALNLESDSFKVFTRNYSNPPHYIAKGASVSKSIISDGCFIEGEVVNSVIHSGVRICAGAKVSNSIIMDGTVIGKNAIVEKSIIDTECRINDKAYVGGDNEITVIGDGVVVDTGAIVKEGTMVDPDEVVEASKEDILCQKTSLGSFAQEAKVSS